MPPRAKGNAKANGNAMKREVVTYLSARLGRTSKMGQRDIRRLLVNGAMSVINAYNPKKGGRHEWLDRLLMRKSRLVAAIALANKMARALWAMITSQNDYRDPVSIAL